MADLTVSELDRFRREFIRDLAIANPAEYLSPFNLSRKREWVTDADIQAINTRIERDYSSELQAVYDKHYYDRLDAGDDTSTAATSAAAQKLEARMRLIRAEVREGQLTDPGYRGSIADERVRLEIAETYAKQIHADRQFIRARSSGQFSALRLERR